MSEELCTSIFKMHVRCQIKMLGGKQQCTPESNYKPIRCHIIEELKLSQELCTDARSHKYCVYFVFRFTVSCLLHDC